MIAPPAAPDPFDALLTPDRERALATAIRAGRRARLLAQRHLTVRLRRELSLTVNARVAAGAVVAALLPHLPLAPDALPAVVDPLLPRTLDQDARARVLAGLAVCLDQEALTAGDAARVAFVAANGRLVVALARRYQHRGLPLDDLVQEGTVGLLRAVDLFDPARGYKFSTYAVWWIKQALRRALARQAPLAHVPANVQMERARLARRAHALHAELGHPPSPGELAAATGLPRARVDALTAPLPAPVPLDQRMGDGETTTLGDLLPDPDADRPAAAEAEELAAAVRAALATLPFMGRFLGRPGLFTRGGTPQSLFAYPYDNGILKIPTHVRATLPPRERAILAARHGLDGAPPRTLQEIGRSLGLTRQAVQQAEARALARLRRPALHRWLADDDTPAAS